jgi:hypothetical protein
MIVACVIGMLLTVLPTDVVVIDHRRSTTIAFDLAAVF